MPFLFIRGFGAIHKIILSIVLAIIYFVLIYFIEGSSDQIDSYSVIIHSLNSGVDILIYPSIAAMIMMNSRRDQLG
jgi:hypothetical protein